MKTFMKKFMPTFAAVLVGALAATAVPVIASYNPSAGGASSPLNGTAGTGVDGNAGGYVIGTGLPTGAGTADLALQSGFILGSGSTAQTTYDRVRITSKTKALSTTTNTPTIIALLSNPVTDSAVGCAIFYTIELIDGAHHVGAVNGAVFVTSVNQNGVLTVANGSTPSTQTQAPQTGGTYTSLQSGQVQATASGTDCQIKVAPTWAAGTPTTVRITYTAIVNGQGNLTPQ